MIPTASVSAGSLLEVLDRVGPDIQRRLEQRLGTIATEMAADARGRAAAHIRSWGAKNPGSYVTSIKGGLAKKKSPTRATGYVRSGHPLAHLLEYGFTISDIMIQAKAADVMAFAGDAGEVFRKLVHRHATKVPPYPAIGPAFEARRAEIVAAIGEAKTAVGNRQ